jgi:hypothetical protein
VYNPPARDGPELDMRNSPDPNVHKQYQQALVGHAQRLLEDERLRILTTGGLKPATELIRDVHPGDAVVAVKQRMIELGLFDRELQRRMPSGQTLDVTLSTRSLFGGQQPAGRLRVVCVSPTDALLRGQEPMPLDAAGVRKVLDAQPPPLGKVPLTLVLLSTSGLTDDARKMAAERQATRNLILVEVNDAGGWTVTTPPGAEHLADLLDPETAAEKLKRVMADVDASTDLLTGGVSAESVAERLHLPKATVERALRDYAGATPGLVARSVEGTVLVYREGLSTVSAGDDPTGEDMPFWEKLKGMFSKTESREKQTARLAQERALLAHQRDKAYVEIEQVERKEAELTASFPSAAPLTQKRIATEISQIRKRAERVQQLVSTIDKKINILETGMHNLEMEHHLSKEKLESLETVAQASEQVDVGMATLEQLNEQADAVSVAGSEISGGAQDVLAELQAKFAEKAEPAEKATGGRQSTGPERSPAQRDRASAGSTASASSSSLPPVPGDRRRTPGAAEPG